jgi:hypothetical protein
MFPKFQNANCATAWQRLCGARKRKYFEKEENFVNFHQMFARVLEAPMEAMALLNAHPG